MIKTKSKRKELFFNTVYSYSKAFSQLFHIVLLLAPLGSRTEDRKASLLLWDRYSRHSVFGQRTRGVLEAYFCDILSPLAMHKATKEDEYVHHTKSLGTGTKEWRCRNSLSHLLSEGKKRGNKSSITDNLFLKLQFIPYPLS